MLLEGWGRFPRHETEVVSAPAPDVVGALQAERSGIVARGNGRAYGDAAIGERTTLSARGLDRMRSFDPATGRLTVEAGVLLSDILETFVPRGFFPPVVPGTKFVTVGGMIAADVHGKNHHRDGGFSDHVEELKIVLPGGEVVACSRHERSDLFAATAGGMGLTGTIVEATFRLRPVETGWMRQLTTVAPDLDAAIEALRETAQASYSVAWIDCLAKGAALGRSLVYAAEHATRAELLAQRAGAAPFAAPKPSRAAVPLDFPTWALHRSAVRAFNELYFRRGAAKAGTPFLVHWDPYFFPLDGIAGWNRIYGRRGFVQHQCVIPDAVAGPVLRDILERVARRGEASFLAVLKQLGKGSGMMSFPLEGYTLALDFPLGDDLLPFLDELDRIVVEAGGRIYLAKDARQSRATFEAGYPGLSRFREVRRTIGAEGRLASRQSTRLGI